MDWVLCMGLVMITSHSGSQGYVRTYVGYVSLLSFDAAADQNMYVHMYLSYQI